MTRLTRDEQYTLMTFFTIFRSPLMFGGDLPGNDAFTLSLLTNAEVLKMHRESTGVRQLFCEGGKIAVTSYNPNGNETYLALFNIDNGRELTIEVNLRDIGLDGVCEVIDMWSGESLGLARPLFSRILKPHACKLYKFTVPR
jgi:hypothetical protein